jgi:hypothetical protein
MRSRLKMFVDSFGRANSGSLVHRAANRPALDGRWQDVQAVQNVGLPEESGLTLNATRHVEPGRREEPDTLYLGATPACCSAPTTRQARVDDEQPRASACWHQVPAANPGSSPCFFPELLHFDRRRDVRVIGVHVLDGIDRVDARKSSVQRGFDAGGRTSVPSRICQALARQRFASTSASPISCR